MLSLIVDSALQIQMTELEKLQKKQKEIEEENKVKQKIIKETISERFVLFYLEFHLYCIVPCETM